MRVLLLHNPGAGDENHPPEELVDLLERAEHEVTWRPVKDPRWQEELEREPDLVAVAGGDGSVQKVLRALVGSGYRATLLPLGSANNIALSAGFPDDDLTQLVSAWEKASMRPYDVMALSDGEQQHLFVEAAGGGLFANALLGASEESDDLAADEKLRYSLELILACVVEAKPLRWTVEVDDDELEVELLALELMNAGTTGPTVPLAPLADPGDSLLDVVFVRPTDREPLVEYFEQRLAGRDADLPRLETHRAAAARFRPPTGSNLHVDDDVITPRAARLTASPAGYVMLLTP
jgi:diacylglycerol kinase family enzyme